MGSPRDQLEPSRLLKIYPPVMNISDIQFHLHVRSLSGCQKSARSSRGVAISHPINYNGIDTSGMAVLMDRRIGLFCPFKVLATIGATFLLPRQVRFI